MTIVDIEHELRNSDLSTRYFSIAFKKLLQLISDQKIKAAHYHQDLESFLILFFKHRHVYKKLEQLAIHQLYLKYNGTDYPVFNYTGIRNDDFFIYTISNCLNINVHFEKKLIQLRKQLLYNGLNDDYSFKDIKDKYLVLAISAQCDHTEYVWFIDEIELDWINALEEELHQLELFDDRLLLYAMYKPISIFRKISAIYDFFSSEDFEQYQSIVSRVFLDDLRRLEEQSHIESISKIDDYISVKVKDQYEESPYPKWKYLRNIRLPIYDFLNTRIDEFNPVYKANPKKLKVLVAGCGTGHQPIALGIENPDYDIIAIDLSQESLSYASFMAKELKVNNIRFYQCDILEIGELNQTFDHIDCTGVIHHMSNQDLAWTSLSSVLRLGGTMYISLYSKLARMEIAALRKRTEQIVKDYTMEKMLSFRHQLINENRSENLKVHKVRDFYTMSTLRDLLFNVCEHQYTIGDIKKQLELNQLRFLCFTLPPKLMKQYGQLYPKDPNCQQMSNWKEFEMKYAGSGAMLSFWCIRQ